MGFRDLSLVNDSLLANKLGNCYTTRILLFTRFSRLGFSLIVLLRRLKIQDQALMLGEVFSREGMLFKERLGGKLGMVKPLKFCMISGSLGNTPRWFHLPKFHQWRKPLLIHHLIQLLNNGAMALLMGFLLRKRLI